MTLHLAFATRQAHIMCMATNPDSVSPKNRKPGVLGRSALTGRYVLAPVVTKKATMSDKQITAAVKSVLAKKK